MVEKMRCHSERSEKSAGHYRNGAEHRLYAHQLGGRIQLSLNKL